MPYEANIRWDYVREGIPYHRPSRMVYGSHMLSNDEQVRELEENIKSYYDVDYVIACSSASIGLLICSNVLHYGIKPYISTPSFGWKSIADIIKLRNIEHKYVDIDRNTWLANTFCNLPVHTFGNIIESPKVNVVYDGAHALGAKIKYFGDATVFSLAPTKLVTACEGGIIVTNNKSFAEICTEYRNNISRMSEPNAFYGNSTFKEIDKFLDWKESLYHYYKRKLPGIFQEIPHSSNYNTIGMLTDLKIPPHIQVKKYYEPLDFSLPNTKYVYNKIVCLPSWYGVDYEKVVNDILEYNEALKSGRVKTFSVS
jgi:dTDP-4-amino-4,6-dideoxygalactose transaminase